MQKSRSSQRRGHVSCVQLFLWLGFFKVKLPEVVTVGQVSTFIRRILCIFDIMVICNSRVYQQSLVLEKWSNKMLDCKSTIY